MNKNTIIDACNSENFNLENLNDTEVYTLQVLLAKASLPKVWMPEIGKYYYYISDDAIVKKSKCKNGQDLEIVLNTKYSIGNCFESKEEAEFRLEKMKVETEIKRYIEANDIEKINTYDPDQIRKGIMYDIKNDEIIVVNSPEAGLVPTIYFSQHLNWSNLFNTIGANRIAKYIFNIENIDA